jgi:hypothetical protein
MNTCGARDKMHNTAFEEEIVMFKNKKGPVKTGVLFSTKFSLPDPDSSQVNIPCTESTMPLAEMTARIRIFECLRAVAFAIN